MRRSRSPTRGVCAARLRAVVHDGRTVAERHAAGFHAHGRRAGRWRRALNALVGLLVDQDSCRSTSGVAPEMAIARSGAVTRSKISADGAACASRSGWQSMVPRAPHARLSRHGAQSGRACRSPLRCARCGATERDLQYSSARRRVVGEVITTRGRRTVRSIGMTSAVLEPDGAGTFVCSSTWSRPRVTGHDSVSCSWTAGVEREGCCQIDPLQHHADAAVGRTFRRPPVAEAEPRNRRRFPAARRLAPDAFCRRPRGQTLSVILETAGRQAAWGVESH
jgi:hypothetical protein